MRKKSNENFGSRRGLNETTIDVQKAFILSWDKTVSLGSRVGDGNLQQKEH